MELRERLGAAVKDAMRAKQGRAAFDAADDDVGDQGS